MRVQLRSQLMTGLGMAEAAVVAIATPSHAQRHQFYCGISTAIAPLSSDKS